MAPAHTSLRFNKAQEATARRLLGAARVVGNYHMGSAIGYNGLIAGAYGGGTGHTLPADQW